MYLETCLFFPVISAELTCIAGAAKVPWFQLKKEKKKKEKKCFAGGAGGRAESRAPALGLLLKDSLTTGGQLKLSVRVSQRTKGELLQ